MQPQTPSTSYPLTSCPVRQPNNALTKWDTICPESQTSSVKKNPWRIKTIYSYFKTHIHPVKMHLDSFKTHMHTHLSRHIPTCQDTYTHCQDSFSACQDTCLHIKIHAACILKTHAYYPLFQDTYPTVKTRNAACQDTSRLIQDSRHFPSLSRHKPTC